MQVNMHEAEKNLTSLGKKVWNGEKVVIAKDGKPYLELVPHKNQHKKRIPGHFKDRIKIDENFDLCDDVITHLFHGD